MDSADTARLIEIAHELDNQIVYDLDAHVYHSIRSRLGSSSIKALDDNPLRFHHERNNPIPERDVFRLGRAFHTATLEPHKYDDEYVVYPGRRDMRTAAYREFLEEHAGKVVLTTTQHDTAHAMARSVRAHRIAAPLLDAGRAEVTIFWRHPTGVPVKVRVDWLGAAATDLKSCVAADPHSFRNATVRNRYHLQFGMYSDAIEAVLGERLRFKAIAVEKAPPYQVVVYDIPEETLQVGREAVDRALRKYLECKEADYWPGIDGGDELDLYLPSWAVAQAQDDLDFDGSDDVLIEEAF